MKQKQEHHIVDILFVLALFGVFTISALILVTIGANVYQNTADLMDSNYHSRVTAAYLIEKVRQNDIENGISIGQLDGTDALLLSQTIDGEEYCTYIYHHQGSIKELFMKKGSDLVGDTLSAGQSILEVEDFSIIPLSSSLFSFQLTTTDGEEHHLYVTSRSHSVEEGSMIP